MTQDTPTAGRTAAPSTPGAPTDVRQVAQALHDAGFSSWLVGDCARARARGLTPSAFSLATRATPDDVLARFPTGVPTDLRAGIVTVPAGGGPVDVVCLRRGEGIEERISRSDFTIRALAYELLEETVLDPHDGMKDFEAGTLRTVGRAEDRLSEDPLRALSAARLVAQLGLAPDAGLEEAMAKGAATLASHAIGRSRSRRELVHVALGPHSGMAIALLRRTGVEAALLPSPVADDSAEVVDALPAKRVLRLAGWLRGTRPHARLRHLRFGPALTNAIGRLVRQHPIDETVGGLGSGRLPGSVRQLEEEELEDLFTLRETEILIGEMRGGSDFRAARDRLRDLREALERARAAEARAEQRRTLALDGHAVMKLLGCPPGRLVGHALAHLAELVDRDPAMNSREALSDALRSWSRPSDDP